MEVHPEPNDRSSKQEHEENLTTPNENGSKPEDDKNSTGYDRQQWRRRCDDV